MQGRFFFTFMEESEVQNITAVPWLAWVCDHGLETPAWFFLELVRLNAGWLGPILELLEPFLPVSDSALLSAISSIQHKLEGKFEP